MLIRLNGRPMCDKIFVAINNNLEEQMKSVFAHMFAEKIDSLEESSTTLSDLVVSVDNRGKTPPLSSEITIFHLELY